MFSAPKSRLGVRRCVTIAGLAAGPMSAWGGAVSGPVIGFEQISPPQLGANYVAGIDQNDNGNFTSVAFSYTGMALAAVYWDVDEESDWYLAKASDVFSAATIVANQFPIIFTTDDPRPPVPIPLGNFWLGVATTTPQIPEPPGFRDVFGWLELYNDGTTLTAVANAVDYGDGGIIVGTTSPAPEPASLLLLAVPLALIALKRRRPT